MANYENFYNGARYSFEPTPDNPTGYRVNASNVAFPTDPMTANQIQALSKKISTGSKSIEVSGLGLTARSAMAHLAAIPKQHWKEIDRLRKLTGVELTFHGPLIEATGVNRGNWSEDQRREVEKQAFEAVKLAQQMHPDGNVVVTFHSSNGLDAVEQKIKVGTKPDGSADERVVAMAVVNERAGAVRQIPQIQKEFLKADEKEGKVPEMTEWLKDFNEQQWREPLQNLAIETNRARSALSEVAPVRGKMDEKTKEQIESAFKLHDLALKNPQEYQRVLESYEKVDPKLADLTEQFNQNINYATAITKNAYLGFKESFNKAMESLEDESEKKKLEEYKEKALPMIKKYENGEASIVDFNNLIIKGLDVLNSIDKDKIPKTWKPAKKWAVETAGKTFGNVAWESYKKFKEHTPIISIENPPVGMSGLTRADEIAALIKQSRKVFEDNAIKGGLSASEAKSQAEKIIGATWDTGHINSIRKWGYDEADVLKEAQTISKYVKHMHIADNLGFEDAELPIGMGNVPIDKILKIKEFQKVKKVIETGDWFSRQGGMAMTYTPMREALSGLDAPVYSIGEMPSGPSWSAANQAYGNYFGGLGPINPPVHHSTYGGGFSNLPVELGGEIPGGQGQSRFSGTPME